MPVHDFPVIYPQTFAVDWQWAKWELHFQEVSIVIAQLCETKPQTIELRLLKEQYATKAQELVAAARDWCWTTDDRQKQAAYQRMMQKYAIVRRLWHRIMGLGGPLSIAS